MKFHIASFAALALAGAILAAPVSANANIPAGIANAQAGQPLTGAPVQVESCVIQPTISPAVASVGSTALGVLAGRFNSVAGYVGATAASAVIARASGAGRLVAKFANEGAVPTDIIRLRVGNGVYVRDEVAIRSGDVVQRSYTENGAFQSYGTAQVVACEIDFVHFADGTSWSAKR